MKEKLLTFSFVVITFTMLSESIYILPKITYPTKQQIYERFLNDGKKLMDIKGIPDGSETLVCTNWVCPTSIVVNAVRYNLVTDEWMGVISADIMTTDSMVSKRAHVQIELESNALEARRSVFAAFVQSDALRPTDFAPYIFVHNLDPMTNMMAVFKTLNGVTNNLFVAYKNLTVFSEAPSNAFDFAAEIINAGLPEEERIPLPPTQ